MEDFSDLVEIEERELIDITPKPRITPPDAAKHTDTKARLDNFARAYLDSGCDAASALKASGYKVPENSAAVVKRAGTLLTHPHVQQALRRMLEPAIKKSNLTLEKTLMQIAAISQVDKRKLYHEDGKAKKPHERNDKNKMEINQ